MSKVLSISVAAYNAEKDIKYCLDSMVNSSVAEDLEIIVVNDGSTDNTSTIVHDYELKYPGIVKLVNKENGGHGSTINASIKVATAKYYKIVDADDWVDADGIEKLIFWLKNNNADLVLNPYHIVDATSRQIQETTYPYDKSQKIGCISEITSMKDILLYMHSLTFSTDVIKKMGPIIGENCFYVDVEYSVFPMLHVKNFVCLDFPVYEYLLGTASQSMNIDNLIKRRDQHLRVTKRVIEFYEKHKNDVCSNVRDIMLMRAQLVATSQYRIYFHASPQLDLCEVKNFDAWLKSYPEVYAGSDDKFIKFIKFNRKSNFRYYHLTSKVLNALHITPKI